MPAAFVDLFSESAAAYAAGRPTYPDALFAHLAALAPDRARAWDCATGSGQAAVGLARHFEQVDATDASAEQLAHTEAHERIRYSAAAAEDSKLPDSAFDLVSVAEALHWFDRARFYAEARRVLKPGGILAVYGYAWFYVAPDIDVLVDEYLLRPLYALSAPNNQLLWDGYRTIEFPFEELTPPRLAIHANWSLLELMSYYRSWSATQSRLKIDGAAFIDGAQQRIEQAWGDPRESRAVVMPLAIRIGKKEPSSR